MRFETIISPRSPVVTMAAIDSSGTVACMESHSRVLQVQLWSNQVVGILSHRTRRSVMRTTEPWPSVRRTAYDRVEWFCDLYWMMSHAGRWSPVGARLRPRDSLPAGRLPAPTGKCSEDTGRLEFHLSSILPPYPPASSPAFLLHKNKEGSCYIYLIFPHEWHLRRGLRHRSSQWDSWLNMCTRPIRSSTRPRIHTDEAFVR